MIYLPPFLTTKYKIMKKIILASLLFSLAALVNAVPTGITLTPNNIDENLPIGTTIGVLSTTDSAGGGSYNYSLKVTSFLFDVGEQGGSSLGSNQLKARPAGNSNGDNDIIIATIIGYSNTGQSPASSLVAAIDSTTGVSAEVVTNGEDSGTVRLTSWPANLNGATLIGFSTTSGGNSVSTITIDSNLDPLPTATFDEQYFEISGSDLVSAIVFDYSVKSSYTINVTTDDGNNTFSQDITVNITENNIVPIGVTLTPNSIFEGLMSGSTVGALSTTNSAGEGGSYSYSLKATSFLFSVGEQGGTNVNSNQFKVRLADDSADITIATIGKYSFATGSPAGFLVTAINTYNTNNSSGVSAEVVNDGPASGIVRLTNWPANLNGAKLIGFTTANSSGSNYNAITIGSDLTIPTLSTTLNEQYFTISGSNLLSATVFDYSVKSSYTINVTTNDGVTDFSQDITVTIKSIDESLSLSSNTVAENNAAGTTVGILATSGGTEPYSYTVSNANPNKAFTFNVTGEDGASNESTNFVIEAIGGSRTAIAYFYFRIYRASGANNPANILSFEINQTEGFSSEYTITGSYTGTITLTDWPDKYDGATLIGSSRTDIDYITIDSGLTLPSYLPFSTDGDKLITTAVLDQATQGSYTITISSTDSSSPTAVTISKDFIITVTEEKTFSLDVDGNQTLNATNDGLIIFKYLLNPDANNLHTTIANDAIEDRKTSAQLKAYLDDAGTILDVDGNETLNATNDGLIIFKYLLNPDANNLHTTIANDALDDRNSTEDLKAYLDSYTE